MDTQCHIIKYTYYAIKYAYLREIVANSNS